MLRFRSRLPKELFRKDQRATEKIFENPLFFLKSSQIEVRSAFLRLIFANCYVDNKKARFSLKKSLSLFVKNRDFELWQPHSDLNRDSRLERAVS